MMQPSTTEGIKVMPCSRCGEDREIWARDLCQPCYRCQRAEVHGACSHCGKSEIAAVGLCGACYQRQRSTGQLAKRLMSNVGKTCSVDGCREHAVVKGMCRHHYDYVRPPLWNTWVLIRNRYPGNFSESWREFDVFLRDVGERPSSKHQLRRIRNDLPWSKGNVRWLQPIRDNAYSPKKVREYHHGWRLRRTFGLEVEDYDRMLTEQRGVCAICGGKQDINKKTGEPRKLGVDHCHTTMQVRGLLCVNCNRGLGYFSDDIERLRSAIAYLEKHAAKKAA